VTSLTLASVAYTPAQITTALQTVVTLYSAVATAQSAVKAKLTAERAQVPPLLDLMVALVAYLKLTYSESPDVLADFGLGPKKERTPLTAEKQTAANAKRDATRKARGTTSKKAKQAVKGNVVDVTITPIVAGEPVVTAVTAPSPTAGTPATGTTGGTKPGQ
jgi:hypothetical protein